MEHRKVGSLRNRPKRVHRKVYRFRMEPAREQGESLMRMAGARRWVWNWGLARRKEVYRATKRGLPMARLSAELTALKGRPETAWLKEVDSQLLQQALQDLDRAFVAFFERRARFPRFKRKKRDEPRFRIPQRVKVGDSKVYVPKVGWVSICQSQPVDGPINRALSAGAACLHGLAHAAILSAGYSPALGFIHTGKQLSFVYDVADIYKAETLIPTAFQVAAESDSGVERRVRHALRQQLKEVKLLERIVSDLHSLFDALETPDPYAADPAAPGELWDPDGPVPGGVAYGSDRPGEGAQDPEG